MIKKYLYKYILPKLFQKKCPERIPRSGEKGEKINCYSVYLEDNENPYLLLRELKDDKLLGLKWSGEEFNEMVQINLSEIHKYQFKVTHYYGLNNIYYDNVYNLVWHYLTKFIYIKINFIERISSINQYFFNKQKLITKKRMELLQFLLNTRLKISQGSFHTIDIMTKLYSMRWVSHPTADDQTSILEFYLDSLVESGELKRVNGNYKLTGKAITTIEKYEEDERRHASLVKIQRKILWVTVILILIGLIQAEVIKLPTLIDFTK